MPVRLYLAPAAGGKTAYLVEQACALASGLAALPRVVVPTQLQARAWQRRLAEAGGALGVRVGTFDTLYREILQSAGQVYTRLTDPIQYRLLRMLVAGAPLVHYAPLRASPGFVQVILALMGELKAGGVFPEAFAAAIARMGSEPRLLELADLYAAYQRRLQDEAWADVAGIGWLAAEALARHPQVGRDWVCLMVDGFDDLTTVQLSVLRELAGRVGELIVTLTGVPQGAPRDPVHRRFNRTRDRLESGLRVSAQPLPVAPAADARAPALSHLEATLFVAEASQVPADGAVALVAAPDREGEVRAALRWLKARLICDGMRLGQVALLARAIDPYRPYIGQVAAEVGLPVHVVSGLPLRSNPAIAALFDLLRLALPGAGAFSWRLTVEAWRSPYFDWSAYPTPDAGSPIGITPQDAEGLDWVARWGSVVGGLEQWDEAFHLLMEAGPRDALDEDTPAIPDILPTGAAAQALHDKFQRFVQRITPPDGVCPCREFVGWLERLIGDTALPEGGPVTDLGVARRVLNGPPGLVERDLAALNALKDVLRGLVWAEEALGCAPMAFADLIAELVGAVNAAVYRPPLPPDSEAVLAADVIQARGVPFRAVAVLGLAEGEFPATGTEDPFLRDADRLRLRDEFGLALDPSTEGAEAGYFYEAITRPRDALLLTRPRIADNGAPWQASPFWEEVRRRVAVEPLNLTGSSYPGPESAASWPELLLGAAARPDDAALWAWATRQDAGRCAALEAAAGILARRVHAVHPAPGVYDGDLQAWGATFARRFGPDHAWSASRLEGYRACPFLFLTGSVLGLEPRGAPAEGLDARQLGNIYHRIFQQLYRGVDDPIDLPQLLAALPKVAEPILDEAPRREQFRATAWWTRTREEIVEHVRRSLVVLDTLRGDYVPVGYELAFGISGRPGEALVVRDGDRYCGHDSFRLRGYIDRVERTPDGRVRIIDYKTGGPWSFTAKALEDGKKLQLPLYALAAQEALGLGQVVDGFYWHVQHADWHLENAGRRGWFTLAGSGAVEVMDRALSYAWEAVRAVRCGSFAPRPPDDGCPSYCPAAAFCWQYAPRSW